MLTRARWLSKASPAPGIVEMAWSSHPVALSAQMRHSVLDYWRPQTWSQLAKADILQPPFLKAASCNLQQARLLLTWIRLTPTFRFHIFKVPEQLKRIEVLQHDIDHLG